MLTGQERRGVNPQQVLILPRSHQPLPDSTHVHAYTRTAADKLQDRKDEDVWIC